MKRDLSDQVATQVATETGRSAKVTGKVSGETGPLKIEDTPSEEMVTNSVTTESAVSKRGNRELTLDGHGELSEEAVIARASVSAEMGATLVRSKFPLEPFGRVDLTEHAREIQRQTERAQRNDMGGVVSMLVSQAHTLEALFNALATKAAKNIDKPALLDIFLRQALRAQSQCRSTLEAVAEIKNPRPVAFIKQQNNAAGHQQVNNGAHPEVTSRST
ncbi:hypothetical protein [Caballeronia sp. LZ001]|uniref:hypothetical protein n=1 Tax=Caballeronia sp. LZ001 TaxID=3038553 RepID=UPI002858AEC9|nr:hypothetical protein [Caballeronia sp. LZ001]MDR5801594.1 hypothetical protein [Caballeronia sp. LZ001]